MKTTTNTLQIPGTAKLFAFIVLISGLAFLSCMVTNAQVSNETTTIAFLDEVNDSYADVLKSSESTTINMNQVWATRLQSALVPETETRMEVEEWMLDTEYTTEAYEENVELEDWMLDTDYFFNEAIYEAAIELEDWMLDPDCYGFCEDNEKPIELEDWMMN